MDPNKTRTSILKPQKPRNPLADLDELIETNDDTTGNIKSRSRRVSFASSNFVKEFVSDPEKNTLWDTTYEEKIDSTNSLEVEPNTTLPMKSFFDSKEAIVNTSVKESSEGIQYNAIAKIKTKTNREKKCSNQKPYVKEASQSLPLKMEFNNTTEYASQPIENNCCLKYSHNSTFSNFANTFATEHMKITKPNMSIIEHVKINQSKNRSNSSYFTKNDLMVNKSKVKEFNPNNINANQQFDNNQFQHHVSVTHSSLQDTLRIKTDVNNTISLKIENENVNYSIKNTKKMDISQEVVINENMCLNVNQSYIISQTNKTDSIPITQNELQVLNNERGKLKRPFQLREPSDNITDKENYYGSVGYSPLPKRRSIDKTDLTSENTEIIKPITKNTEVVCKGDINETKLSEEDMDLTKQSSFNSNEIENLDYSKFNYLGNEYGVNSDGNDNNKTQLMEESMELTQQIPSFQKSNDTVFGNNVELTNMTFDLNVTPKISKSCNETKILEESMEFTRAISGTIVNQELFSKQPENINDSGNQTSYCNTDNLPLHSVENNYFPCNEPLLLNADKTCNKTKLFVDDMDFTQVITKTIIIPNQFKNDDVGNVNDNTRTNILEENMEFTKVISTNEPKIVTIPLVQNIDFTNISHMKTGSQNVKSLIQNKKGQNLTDVTKLFEKDAECTQSISENMSRQINHSDVEKGNSRSKTKILNESMEITNTAPSYEAKIVTKPLIIVTDFGNTSHMKISSENIKSFVQTEKEQNLTDVTKLFEKDVEFTQPMSENISRQINNIDVENINSKSKTKLLDESMEITKAILTNEPEIVTKTLLENIDVANTSRVKISSENIKSFVQTEKEQNLTDVTKIFEKDVEFTQPMSENISRQIDNSDVENINSKSKTKILDESMEITKSISTNEPKIVTEILVVNTDAANTSCMKISSENIKSFVQTEKEQNLTDVTKIFEKDVEFTQPMSENISRQIDNSDVENINSKSKTKILDESMEITKSISTNEPKIVTEILVVNTDAANTSCMKISSENIKSFVQTEKKQNLTDVTKIFEKDVEFTQPMSENINIQIINSDVENINSKSKTKILDESMEITKAISTNEPKIVTEILVENTDAANTSYMKTSSEKNSFVQSEKEQNLIDVTKIFENNGECTQPINEYTSHRINSSHVEKIHNKTKTKILEESMEITICVDDPKIVTPLEGSANFINKSSTDSPENRQNLVPSVQHLTNTKTVEVNVEGTQPTKEIASEQLTDINVNKITDISKIRILEEDTYIKNTVSVSEPKIITKSLERSNNFGSISISRTGFANTTTEFDNKKPRNESFSEEINNSYVEYSNKEIKTKILIKGMETTNTVFVNKSNIAEDIIELNRSNVIAFSENSKTSSQDLKKQNLADVTDGRNNIKHFEERSEYTQPINQNLRKKLSDSVKLTAPTDEFRSNLIEKMQANVENIEFITENNTFSDCNIKQLQNKKNQIVVDTNKSCNQSEVFKENMECTESISKPILNKEYHTEYLNDIDEFKVVRQGEEPVQTIPRISVNLETKAVTKNAVVLKSPKENESFDENVHIINRQLETKALTQLDELLLDNNEQQIITDKNSSCNTFKVVDENVSQSTKQLLCGEYVKDNEEPSIESKKTKIFDENKKCAQTKLVHDFNEEKVSKLISEKNTFYNQSYIENKTNISNCIIPAMESFSRDNEIVSQVTKESPLSNSVKNPNKTNAPEHEKFSQFTNEINYNQEYQTVHSKDQKHTEYFEKNIAENSKIKVYDRNATFTGTINKHKISETSILNKTQPTISSIYNKTCTFGEISTEKVFCHNMNMKEISLDKGKEVKLTLNANDGLEHNEDLIKKQALVNTIPQIERMDCTESMMETSLCTLENAHKFNFKNLACNEVTFEICNSNKNTDVKNVSISRGEISKDLMQNETNEILKVYEEKMDCSSPSKSILLNQKIKIDGDEKIGVETVADTKETLFALPNSQILANKSSTSIRNLNFKELIKDNITYTINDKENGDDINKLFLNIKHAGDIEYITEISIDFPESPSSTIRSSTLTPNRTHNLNDILKIDNDTTQITEMHDFIKSSPRVQLVENFHNNELFVNNIEKSLQSFHQISNISPVTEKLHQDIHVTKNEFNSNRNNVSKSNNSFSNSMLRNLNDQTTNNTDFFQMHVSQKENSLYNNISFNETCGVTQVTIANDVLSCKSSAYDVRYWKKITERSSFSVRIEKKLETLDHNNKLIRNNISILKELMKEQLKDIKLPLKTLEKKRLTSVNSNEECGIIKEIDDIKEESETTEIKQIDLITKTGIVSAPNASLIQEIEKKILGCYGNITIHQLHNNTFEFFTLFDTIKIYTVFKDNRGIVDKYEVQSLISDDSEPVALFVHNVLKEFLSQKIIQAAIGIQYDILSLLDYVYMQMEKIFEFLDDFYDLNTDFLLKMNKNFRVTFEILHLPWISWNFTVDMSDLENITSNSISVSVNSRRKPPNVETFMNNCPSGLLFLKCFVHNVSNYVKTIQA